MNRENRVRLAGRDVARRRGVATPQHWLAIACVAVTAAGAAADPKPTLAIVGLTPKDHDSAKLADALTTSLRAVAGGRYSRKGTPKEIVAAIEKADCDANQPVCAAAVGAELAVDYVLTGEVESRGAHPILVLALVNVKTHQRVRSLRDSVAKSVEPRKWAAAVYDRIAGAKVGDLVIVANAQHADVFVDGESVAALFDGRTTITGIAIGDHQLEIRAPGYRPFSLVVTIDGTTRETLLLDPL